MRATSKKRGAFRSVQGTMSVGAQKSIELPDGMWERISKKAYELWEARGRREGRELENWLDAEAIVMEEIHEARE